MATKPRGGGLKALVAGPLKKEFFFAASKTYIYSNIENRDGSGDRAGRAEDPECRRSRGRGRR